MLLLTKDSKLFSWGKGANGHLGLGLGVIMSETPKILHLPLEHSDEKITHVACGASMSFAVTDAGDLYGWGHCYPPKRKIKWQPEKIPFPDEIKISGVGCGYGFVVVQTTTGDLYGWGGNSYGELGLGKDRKYSPEPTKITIPEKVSKIFCGGQHCFSKTKNGNLWAWGWNGYGNLGLGDRIQRNEPELCSVEEIVGVAAGNGHSHFLFEDGTVKGTGSNDYGAIGAGRITEHHRISTPIKIEFPFLEEREKIISIGTGCNHCWGLSNFGRLYMWGYGHGGILGFGDEDTKFCPTLHEGIYVIPQISECWERIFRWLFCGRKDENSVFAVLPIEVLWNATSTILESVI
jgi:hypothetical protein